MKDTLLMFAKDNKETNKTVFDLLDKLSNEDREKDRGSHYGSLSGLLRHILGGTIYFQGMFKSSLKGTMADPKALSKIDMISFPDAQLSADQWKSLAGHLEAADQATISFIEGLNEDDFQLPINIDWYEGSPATVPLFFLLNQLMVHHIHHRGQISQILDEMKVDNDFSGININFLPEP
ncbi:DinB family protein [Breznakiella homolactica]|uniref:Damage-inducible protein DinB n=1 Tax=Breznakiella homolactica TaxID=2798577 RepID=A0A7T7XR99_9SPIR|nr:DinB family protein [Breznakiella homolactica]QQO11041.1 damage-inducible protein DinB [Breznakiella homolactica]